MSLGACKKFLDEKPNVVLATPTTLNDLQALLDHYQVLNFVDGSTTEVSSTDFYLTDADFNAQSEQNQRMYTWQKSDIYASSLNEWFYNYRAIYRANSVIGFLDEIPRNTVNQQQWENISGMAHFYRAKNLSKTLIAYALNYRSGMATEEIGVPIRWGTDFNQPSVRASIAAGYSAIIEDAQKAIASLPEVQTHVMRPNKPAAYALLARVFMSMNDYSQAYHCADSALRIKGDLLDFNELNASAAFPIPQFNVEVLHDSFMPGTILSNARAKIDPELYKLYDANDLRRTIFFKNNGNGTYGFKGSYEGSASLFSGIATDEVYLMRAECAARLNDLQQAVKDLNSLLNKRYRTNTFTPIIATTQAAVLERVLVERRKELLMRGLRWMDVKRLNVMGSQITLERTVNGVGYQLKPNSRGFALPLPEDMLRISGMPQNTY